MPAFSGRSLGYLADTGRFLTKICEALYNVVQGRTPPMPLPAWGAVLRQRPPALARFNPRVPAQRRAQPAGTGSMPCNAGSAPARTACGECDLSRHLIDQTSTDKMQ